MIDLKNILPENIIPEKLKDMLADGTTRRYIISGTIAGLAVLYLIFLVLPDLAQLSKISNEVKDLNLKINLVNSRVKRLEDQTMRMKILKFELSGYSKGLPGQKEIPQFLEDLSEMARVSNVKILSITPAALRTELGEGGKNWYYLEMGIKITAQSGFHQLGHFISSLEEGTRFITIEGMRIVHNDRSPRKHNIKLLLKTYVAVA